MRSIGVLFIVITNRHLTSQQTVASTCVRMFFRCRVSYVTVIGLPGCGPEASKGRRLSSARVHKQESHKRLCVNNRIIACTGFNLIYKFLDKVVKRKIIV